MTCKYSVFCLLKIVGFGIVVYILANLFYAWQRMQYAQVVFGVLEHLVVKDVHVFYLFVFHQVGKTFFLHTSHVQYIGAVDGFWGKIGVLGVPNLFFVAKGFVLIGDPQLCRRHKIERGTEMRKSLNERMYCPAIFEVAYNRNREVLERPLRFVDGKKVITVYLNFYILRIRRK